MPINTHELVFNKTKSYSGPTGADVHGGMSMGSSNKSSYGGYQGNPHR